jgi:anti-sigma B factor antagonist
MSNHTFVTIIYELLTILEVSKVVPTVKIKTMSQTSTCALWEEQRLNSQDKEPKLRLSLETRVTEDVTVICCQGRITYGIEAAALSGEIDELAPQTRRVVIDLSGVEMIDAAGLGALISVALTAQASQCSIKLAAPGNLIRQLLELTKLTSVFELYPTLDAATVASRGHRHDQTPATTMVSAQKVPSPSADQPDRLALEGGD